MKELLIPIKASEELPKKEGRYHVIMESSSPYKGDWAFVAEYSLPCGFGSGVKYWYKPVSIDKLDKVIGEVEDMHPYKQAGNRDSYSEYNEGWSDACDILGQRIKELLTNKQ